MIRVVNRRTYVGQREKSANVYIGRPSVLGNPFRIGGKYTRDEAIEAYKEWFREKLATRSREVIKELRFLIELHRQYGEVVLVCWCKPLACHGDVIREYLEEEIKKGGEKG